MVALLLLGLLQSVDFAVRWRRSFAFLADTTWWLSVVPWLLVSAGCWAWIIHRPQRFWLAGSVAFLLTNVNLGVAGAGCRQCDFDWTSAVLMHPFFTINESCAWLEVWGTEGNWAAGILAALSASVLLAALRHTLRDPASSRRPLLTGFGWALLCLLPLSLWETRFCDSHLAGNLPQLRIVLWASVACIALGLLLLQLLTRSDAVADSRKP